MAIKLFNRHVARGWDRATMRQYILDADRRLSLPAPPPTNQPTDTLSNKECLFIHMEYHSNDIPRRLVRAIYNYACKDTLETIGIQQVTIAY